MRQYTFLMDRFLTNSVKYLGVLLIAVFLSNCADDDVSILRESSIIAGGENENMLIQSYDPVDTIKMLTDPIGPVTTATEGVTILSLSNDPEEILIFDSYQGLGISYSNWNYIEACIISTYGNQFLDIQTTPLLSGDTISIRGDWFSVGKGGLSRIFNESYISFVKAYRGEREYFNPWKDEAYMAIKYTKDGHTRLGWIKLKIDKFHLLQISEFVIQE